MRIRISKDDRKWSELVRRRDGACRKCGRKAPWKLEAHHIMPRGRSATRYDLDNGMTLCVLCHKFGPEAVHRIGTKDFMVPLIGAKELKRLERKSLVTMSRKEAVRIFQEWLNEH